MKEWEAPVFYPTKADLDGPFDEYIQRIERRFAKYGICRIIPPKGWTPRKAGYDRVDFTVNKPIRQHATGKKGLFRALLIEGKPMNLKKEFKPMAMSPECSPPNGMTDPSELERTYWKNVTLNPPLYGADCPGSLFDKSMKEWNIGKLDSLLSRTLTENKQMIPGVVTPYLYFGTWRSTFAWHAEDLDLYSVNYLHFGAKKFWYCIPPEYKARFEQVLKGLLPDLFRNCKEFMRHKELLVSPWLLQQYNIPVIRMVHEPGQFVINYPGAYHSGFNHGFNCAESTNFATPRWVPIGRKAGKCECSGDSVSIDMDLFSPRKRKKKEEESSDEEEEEEKPVKRGPGRPPKNALSPNGVRPRVAPGKKIKPPVKVLPDGTVVFKRGPGRPPKNAQTLVGTPIKRGPGRPPNSLKVGLNGQIPVAKRGRPPLSVKGGMAKAVAAKMAAAAMAAAVVKGADGRVVLTKKGLPRKKPGPKPKALKALLLGAAGGSAPSPVDAPSTPERSPRSAAAAVAVPIPMRKKPGPKPKHPGAAPFVPRRKRAGISAGTPARLKAGAAIVKVRLKPGPKPKGKGVGRPVGRPKGSVSKAKALDQMSAREREGFAPSSLPLTARQMAAQGRLGQR